MKKNNNKIFTVWKKFNFSKMFNYVFNRSKMIEEKRIRKIKFLKYIFSVSEWQGIIKKWLEHRKY